MFSLCHATRRLPHGWRTACQGWARQCDNPAEVEYVLCVDTEASFGQGVQSFGRMITVTNPKTGSSTAAFNAAAAASSGQLLIVVADDYLPCKHWDTEILKCLSAQYIAKQAGRDPWAKFDNPADPLREEYVISVDNQDNSPLITHPILTRAYYQRYGRLFYPDYLSIQADADFTEVAERDGVVIHAKHLKFTHHNPGSDPAGWDEAYAWQRRPEALRIGEEVLSRRRAANFEELVKC